MKAILLKCVKQADMKIYPGFIRPPQLQIHLQKRHASFTTASGCFWPLICILHDISERVTSS